MSIGWRSDDKSIRNSLSFKAKHYNDNEKIPFIIICNVILFGKLDEIDIMSALFGIEVYKFNIYTKEGYVDRKFDGLWRDPQGVRNRKLNGIFF